MQRDPNCFKDQAYMQNHTELDAYLNAHPDVRNDLMANPQSFVQGAQQFNGSAGAGVSGGVQMNGRGTATGAGATGTSTTPSTTTPATTHDTTKPNQ
jgi:hypothetical protein